MTPHNDRSLKGYAAAIVAFMIWGLLPIYWDAVKQASPLEVLSHRIIWCSVFLGAYLMWTRELIPFVRTLLESKKAFGLLVVNALLISANWFVYIWAINAGHVMETSLGYFINPIFSVLLGFVILRERLNIYQWAGVALVCLGVANNLASSDHFPWIAFHLSLTFSFYGLIKKVIRVGNLQSLWFESSIGAIPCFIFLIHGCATHQTSFLHRGISHDTLLVLSGIVTLSPLVLFGISARLLPLSTVGFLQFISPTLQFLLAIFYFGEGFNNDKFMTFTLIWVAIALYLVGLSKSARVRLNSN